ncbi:MAG: group II intron reverse transcriptase/maturase [Xenococcaceae cyanobacterium]
MSKTDLKSNTVEWRELNWRKIQKAVWKLQKRIYRAYISGDVRKGRRLQKTLINSYYNRLLSVRKVTQDNQGKKTAGVDKVKSLTPKQRLELAENLKLGDKSKPIRRVWIPKPGRDEKRPLGIPVMRDRAVQALAKAALEPEWESKFEGNSYGFRPGRSAHDAIGAIFNQIKQKPKFVLDADISKCFDQINHKKLLTKLNTFPKLRKQVKAWLKADICDYVKHERTPTARLDMLLNQEHPSRSNHQGMPQGGVISPLLSNIALHGMENRIKQIKGASLIRYADDFVIFHENLDGLKQCQQIICEWLAQFDLELKPSKTRKVHTLNELDDQKPGFDFLGFNIRQYKVGKHQSGKTSHGIPLGYKTIIKPSDKSVRQHYQKLSEIINRLNAAPQALLIKELNPIIRGWCNYFKSVCSKETFSKLYNLTHLRLRRWADRRHPNKNKHWVSKKYWTRVGNDNWVFGCKLGENLFEIIKHPKIAIKRHTKVRSDYSPYDENTLYWANRMRKHPELRDSTAKMLHKQNGKCNWCGLSFQEDDLIEDDHIIPRKAGGNNSLNNRQLLHKHCHDKKTRDDLKAIKAYKQEKEWIKLTKWFDHQNWIWVDDIPTLVDGYGIHKEPDYRGAQ